jgi:histidinol phosphatase-like enzyme
VIRYCFDLDGTICSLAGIKYEKALPLRSRIEEVNSLYDAGHYIIIQTARGSSRAEGEDKEKVHNLTMLQLEEWGVKYHILDVGNKIAADFYIDDKSINATQYFG